MDKLKMQTENIVDENIEFIAKKFPNAIVEAKDENGNLTRMVDFDVLKQELSKVVVDGDKERYQMTWPDKKQAILTANSPIAKTLRPCKEESVDFDNTKNIYIEGDNLDVLKVLRETYLGKIKMIYIDPPYNTGNDFVYNDDFATDTDDYLQRSNQVDIEGNKMVINSESKGRFHTDWLNMMYPRLKVAKDLLSEDGAIFISIDDHEQANMTKLCDEIFGNSNFEGALIWKTKTAAKGVPTKNMLVTNHDYILVYSKNKGFRFLGEGRDLSKFSNPDNDSRGLWKADNMKSTISPNYFTIIDPNTGNKFTKNWAFSQETLKKMIQENKILWPADESGTPRQKRFLKDMSNDTTPFRTLFGEFQSETATNKLKEMFDGHKVFDFPKHVDLLKTIINQANLCDGIVVDFFSGSATTAHAVMQLNAEDGGNRKYIMVQLPELTDEKSEAYKAGYKNICELGKERIRRAGKKIKEENPNAQNLDLGFRVFKLDSSNMKDTYYKPADYSMDLLDSLDENIKPDRRPEDLLFQVMLDLGLMLDSHIEEKTINGKKVFIVGEYNDVLKPDLVCCFDAKVDDKTVTEIAKLEPRFAVFRDSSIEKDSVAVNFDQIFETYSPSTTRKVL